MLPMVLVKFAMPLVTAVWVKAVVAILPLLSPEDLVGAVGAPVNTGLFNGAR